MRASLEGFWRDIGEAAASVEAAAPHTSAGLGRKALSHQSPIREQSERRRCGPRLF
ncbi:MAG: hypothetical protein OJF47_002416 [Nitrospira sp.]|nr:MAG: hypothetical protein OJF47_002416 [Nitrospira sp.]